MKYLDLSLLSVLVVDDNRHLRDIVVQILRALGIRKILGCEDSISAFQQLCRNPVDIAIVDNRMSPVTGTDFTRLVRHSPDSPNPYLPILMITGYADKGSIIAARNAGVHDIIAKPLSAAVLSNRIADLITHPRNFVRTNSYFGPDRRDGRGMDTGDRRRNLDAEPLIETIATLPDGRGGPPGPGTGPGPGPGPGPDDQDTIDETNELPARRLHVTAGN